MAVSLRDFTSYDAREIEKLVLTFWEANSIPQRLSEKRKGAKKFFLLDGPPYVNALPHVGHVKTTSCKDIWSRYKQMRGYDCVLQPGFDCHGLPVEVIVEKDLKIERKSQIIEMGVDKFMQECLNKILNNEKAWMGYYKQLGAWRAFFEPYFTYKPYYIQSAWWTFKQLYEKGMVVQGPRSIHWCPHCETALSGYEVSDSYKDVADPSVFIKFKLKEKENEFLLVWTTTPWTLPANVAIAVAPKQKYLKVKSTNPDTDKQEILIVAEKLVEKVFEMVERKYEVVATLLGSELEGLQYQPVIDCEAQRELNYNERARRVYLSIPVMVKKKYKKHVKGKGSEETEEEFEHFVTMSDGTGLVHCAPGHGQTDNLFGKHYNLPVVSPVNEQGLFTQEVEQWKGKFVKSAGMDKAIIEYLNEKDELFHSDKIVHPYPLCWRCKTPLIFRVSEQIFLSIEPIKAKMLHENNYANWMPEFGQEAFANWVAQANDWCVSQQRFWGIPIPIWKCTQCGSKKVIGSVAELKENALENEHNSKIDFDNLHDLHRGTVDAIELACSSCKQDGKSAKNGEGNASMKRVPDIFNVWVDSGIAPWASLGYPFHNKELFEKVFPVDLVNESQDQVRGWFYAMQFLSAATFSKPAFKSVAMMGWVVDEKGVKMSKSLGNVVSADTAIEKIGADALRLYFCWDIAPWDTQKFSFTNALEARRTLGIIFNSLKFYEMYTAGGKQPLPSGEPDLQKLPLSVEDRWILSRLNTVSQEVAQKIENFEFHHAGKITSNFVVEELSRWYIKLARDRVAPQAPQEQRSTALAVLRHVLVENSKLLAPITPFLSEYVYQRLCTPDSEHSHGSGLQAESVHFATYPVKNELFVDAQLEESMRTAMAITQAGNALRQENKLKLRWPLKRIIVCGGEKAKQCVEKLSQLLQAQNNVQSIEYASEGARVTGEQLVQKQVLLQTGETISVTLDLQRDEVLEKEALLRELLRAIQASRKQNGLVVSEKIVLQASAGESKLNEFLHARASEIAREVGAAKVEVVDSLEQVQGEFSAYAEVDGVGSISARYSRQYPATN